MKVKELIKVLAQQDLELEVVFKSEQEDFFDKIRYASKGFKDNDSVYTGWNKKDLIKEFDVADKLEKCIVLE